MAISLAEKIRLRLAASAAARAVSESVELECPADFESCKKSLQLAVYLTLRTEKFRDTATLNNTATVTVHRLVGAEACEKWFSQYCLEPYPSMCVCGAGYIGNSGHLRTHCPVCKGVDRGSYAGATKWKFANYIERLRVNCGVHYSWAEYAIAWALYKIAVQNTENRSTEV